jgi:hypothetical protein
VLGEAHAFWQDDAETIEESGLRRVWLGHTAQADLAMRCGRQSAARAIVLGPRGEISRLPPSKRRTGSAGRVTLHEGDRVLALLAGGLIRLDADDLVRVHDKISLLTLADVSFQFRCLLEGHPDRSGVVLLDGGRPQHQNIDALIGNAIPPQRSRNASGGMLGFPRLVPRPSPGSRLDADHPENGVLIPRRFTVGRLLGHKNPATTQRYAHLANDPLRMVGEQVAKTLGAALNGDPTLSKLQSK